MNKPTRQIGPWQRDPLVRLRRETWGGLAFHRTTGDLLELDAEGFAVLAALDAARNLPSLRQTLHARELPARLPELAAFMRLLETRRFVQQVAAPTPDLAPDPWAAWESGADPAGLRAPLVAHWAVTYRCNLHCPFCYSESGPFREPGPEAALRLRLVERLAAWGVFEVALGGGEPTILPDLPELLGAIRAAGMVPNVTTNGLAAPERVVRALAAHVGVVHLSADRPELLDAARGAGVFAHLRTTAQALHTVGVRLGVNLLLTPDNIRAVRYSLDALLELPIQAVTFLRPKGAWVAERWPGFPSADDLAILMADLKAFMAERPPLRLYVDTALRGEWASCELFADPEPEVLGCGGGQRHVAVTPEGDVYPCSHVRLPGYRMGNLLRDDLTSLWQTGAGAAARRRYQADCAGTHCACRKV